MPSFRSLDFPFVPLCCLVNFKHRENSNARIDVDFRPAQAIQHWLLSASFAAGDVHLLAPVDHPTKGDVVLRYRGKNSSDPGPEQPGLRVP
jgi:hypothetical protein